MNYPWQITLTLAAGIVMVVLACVALSQKKILVSRSFAGVCFLASIWCFIYACQLQSTSLDEKLFFNKLGFTIIGFLPVFALETTYRFVYERRLFRGWLVVAALFVPAVTAVLAWTINLHPILRYDYWMSLSGPLPLLRYTTGPWSTIFYAYVYGFAIWSLCILLRAAGTAKTPWMRRACLLIVLSRSIPVIFDILYHFHALPPAGMNYAPASMALTDIILAIVFFGDRVGYRSFVAHSTLVEKISDLLVVLDNRQRVLDINHAASLALGTSLKDVQSEPAEKLFAAWPEILTYLNDWPNAVEITREEKCFELTALPLDEGNRESGMILWLRDITRRKDAELAHLEAATSAREANLAKDRYLSVMSHEIRSPLNSVLGFMRLLENTSLNQEQKEYVGHVARSGDNLLGVINEVLDFAKIEAGRMHLSVNPFDFRKEAESLCCGMKMEAAAKGIAFAYHFAEDVPAVLLGDKLRVNQILHNLIANAIKFTSKGHVKITVDCLPEQRTAPDCLLRIAVEDTGIGIAPREMKTLFQPFSQATASIQHRYGGTGLGLLIARRFSELMGGTITVESVPRQGSTFTCLLKLGIGNRLAPHESNSMGTAPAAPLRILIVDDQPANRRLLQIMLGRMHHETETAANGFECLALLQKQSFDVVIMDIEMPGIDGFEASRQIRENSRESAIVPHILALTAHASTDIREQCLAAGMDGYLAKPITTSALKEALSSAAPR